MLLNVVKERLSKPPHLLRKPSDIGILLKECWKLKITIVIESRVAKMSYATERVLQHVQRTLMLI